jgi:hypothetical protein
MHCDQACSFGSGAANSEMFVKTDQPYDTLFRGSGGETTHTADAEVDVCTADVRASLWDTAHVLSAHHEAENANGEDLLSTIDQLYNQFLGDPSNNEERREVSDASAVVATDGDAPVCPDATDELQQDLQEVLWSALFMQRGAGDRIDVQASLLELLPAESLAQSLAVCGQASLTPSFLHRLACDLPDVHAALFAAVAVPSVSRGSSVPELVSAVRAARDALLSLASVANISWESMLGGSSNLESSTGHPQDRCMDSSSDGVPADTSVLNASKRPSRKPLRRSSLSHWLAEDLVAKDPTGKRVAGK